MYGQHWISVEDRLPANGKETVIYLKPGVTDRRHWQFGRWRVMTGTFRIWQHPPVPGDENPPVHREWMIGRDDEDADRVDLSDVSHWMPLPPPPPPIPDAYGMDPLFRVRYYGGDGENREHWRDEIYGLEWAKESEPGMTPAELAGEIIGLLEAHLTNILPMNGLPERKILAGKVMIYVGPRDRPDAETEG